MNSYEIEAKLSRKVEDWQYRALEQDLNHSVREIQNLREEVANLQNSVRNQYSAIENLINVLTNNDSLSDAFDALHQIKMYL